MVLKYIRNFFKRTIPNSIQRMKKGYGFCDVWNFDYYLAKIIINGLSDLRKKRGGFPSNLTDEEWDKILQKVISTFETVIKIIDRDVFYISTNNKNFNIEYGKQVRRFEKYKSDTKVMTFEESKEYEDGWDLFKTWFFDFWD